MAFLDCLRGNIPHIKAPRGFGDELAIVAISQLGKGESLRNNAGEDVEEYRAGRGGNGAWCAAFVSWCIEQAAENLGVECPVERSHGARRLFRNALRNGYRVEHPRKGDLVLWKRGTKAWQGHIGIVRSVRPDGTFHAVEGNRGRFPAKVDIFRHQLGEGGLLGFCRIR